MTQRSDTVRLQHMRDAAERAVRLSNGRSRTDLDSDELYGLAMVRLIEIVGEAVARVTQTTQDNSPQIPWAQIVGARNRLIHGYDQVNFDILWDILQLDLPPLIQALDQIIAGSVSSP